MDPIELEHRIKNHPPTSLAGHCASCGDDGLLEVQYRDDGSPELGPCPFCMKGYRVEFPVKRPGPWGTQGFWRGRQIPFELLRHPSQDRPLPKAEQLVEARKLLARLGAGIGRSMDEPGRPTAERVSDEKWFAEGAGKPKQKEGEMSESETTLEPETQPPGEEPEQGEETEQSEEAKDGEDGEDGDPGGELA